MKNGSNAQVAKTAVIQVVKSKSVPLEFSIKKHQRQQQLASRRRMHIFPRDRW